MVLAAIALQKGAGRDAVRTFHVGGVEASEIFLGGDAGESERGLRSANAG
jgi:hypothetical protein